jgi:hypothetical protein
LSIGKGKSATKKAMQPIAMMGDKMDQTDDILIMGISYV